MTKWRKVRIGDFLSRVKDLVPIHGLEEYKLVTIKLYHRGVTLRKQVKGSEIQADKMSKVKAGQFILSGIDARNGAFGIIPDELDGAIVTNDFWHFEIDTNVISKEYFLWLTSTPFFDNICKKASDGTTNRIRLQADRFYNQELMIPEIQDQDQVVLMLKSTDFKIKSLQAEYQSQLTLLTQLNQAILQEAVQGQLVPQDPQDEPASILLQRIKAEKGKLIENKEIKIGKLQSAEISDELLFEIPSNWEWCNLDELCSHITDGTHQTPTYTKKGMIFLSAQNVKPFRFMPEDHKFVSEEAYREYIKNRKPEKEDILVARVGAGIGEAAIIDREIDFCFYVSLGLIKPFKKMVNSKYLVNVINSPYGVKYSKGNISSKGGSAGNFNLGRIRSFPIPLPPLAEQARIVTAIEYHLAKTAALKAQVLANQAATEQLLQALLQEAFVVEEG